MHDKMLSQARKALSALRIHEERAKAAAEQLPDEADAEYRAAREQLDKEHAQEIKEVQALRDAKRRFEKKHPQPDGDPEKEAARARLEKRHAPKREARQRHHDALERFHQDHPFNAEWLTFRNEHDLGFTNSVGPVLEELVRILETPGDEVARRDRHKGVVDQPKQKVVRALRKQLGILIAPCFLGDKRFEVLAEWVPEELREPISNCGKIAEMVPARSDAAQPAGESEPWVGPFTQAALAERFGKTDRTIRTWITEEVIRTKKVGGSFLVHRADLPHAPK